MIRIPHAVRVPALTLAAAVLLSSWTTAFAGNYDDKDFSLRFPAALTRFATYGDVAGVGGASAGSKWSTSVNPASTAWMEDPPRKISVSPQYTRLSFDNGSVFEVPAQSLSVDAGPAGYFTGSAAQVTTNREAMSSGLGFRFNANMEQLLWAKKLSKEWAVGSAFTYSKSLTRLTYGDYQVAKCDSESYALRGGVLRKITDQWLAGLVVDYGWSSDRTNMAGMPGRIYDSTRQFLVRPGVSYEYMTDGTVYLDYQYGTFSNDTGLLTVHRICTGVEHGFTKWLFARAGTTIDPAVGSCSWTCGLGLYPASWFSLDVGYQNDMFPEMSKEFGRSHTLTVSVSFTF